MSVKIYFSFTIKLLIDFLHLSAVYMEQLSSKAFQNFFLFLTHVEFVLNDESPHFQEAPLFDSHFSISLSTLNFSLSVFTESFLFNILKSTTEKEWLKITCFYSTLPKIP